MPGVAVDLLQVLDPVDVRPRLGELDADALAPPAVDVPLARVVGREHEPLVAVLVEEVAEVPGAVADVDLRVGQVADVEGRAAGAQRDPLRRRRASAASARSRPSDERASRPELRLLVDHRRDERRVEPSRVRPLADDRRCSGAGSGAARTTAGSSRGRRTTPAAPTSEHGQQRHGQPSHPVEIGHHRGDERLELGERAGVHVRVVGARDLLARRGAAAARARRAATAERARRSFVGAVITTTLSNRPSAPAS